MVVTRPAHHGAQAHRPGSHLQIELPALGQSEQHFRWAARRDLLPPQQAVTEPRLWSGPDALISESERNQAVLRKPRFDGAI